MSFPKAYAGVKKIRTAEILGLITAVCMFVIAILTLLAVAGAAAEEAGVAIASLAGVGLLAIVVFVLAVIAFIMEIVGIANAGKDEKQFKNAMIALIVSIAAYCASKIFANNEGLKDVFETVYSVAELLVTIYIINGISALAQKLGDGAVAKRGATILKMIGCVYGLLLISDVILIFVSNDSVLGAVLALIAALLSVVQYFFYLGFLGKGVKMLAGGDASAAELTIENAVADIKATQQDVKAAAEQVAEKAEEVIADVKEKAAEAAEDVSEGAQTVADDFANTIEKLRDGE